MLNLYIMLNLYKFKNIDLQIHNNEFKEKL